MLSLPTSQLALFALCWGLHLVIFFVSPAILEVLMRLGEGLFDTQLTAQNYLTFLWHTTLPLGVLFELPVLVAFLTSIGLLTPQFLITYPTIRLFCPAWS